MKRKIKILPNIFSITEKSLPVHSFKPQDAGIYFSAVELEIRNIIRQGAESKYDLSEIERENTMDLKIIYLGIIENVLDKMEDIFNHVEQKSEEITPKMKKWVGNFRTIYRLTRNLLRDHGVVEIENIDNGFDPQWHDADEKIKDTTKPEGTIVKQLRKGYVWRNQLLRRSKVVVVCNQE